MVHSLRCAAATGRTDSVFVVKLSWRLVLEVGRPSFEPGLQTFEPTAAMKEEISVSRVIYLFSCDGVETVDELAKDAGHAKERAEVCCLLLYRSLIGRDGQACGQGQCKTDLDPFCVVVVLLTPRGLEKVVVK